MDKEKRIGLQSMPSVVYCSKALVLSRKGRRQHSKHRTKVRQTGKSDDAPPEPAFIVSQRNTEFTDKSKFGISVFIFTFFIRCRSPPPSFIF